jgi:hypothetical protein
MDNNGQITVEYLLIMGFGVLISILIACTAVQTIELNTCMAAARNGAVIGVSMDSLAVYPTEKFHEYAKNYPRLKSSSKIIFIGLNYEDEGFDPKYQKIKIRLKITASASSIKNENERDCAGDRINYYVRKCICETFNTENLTNVYYNPAFTNRYVITTSEVEWK